MNNFNMFAMQQQQQAFLLQQQQQMLQMQQAQAQGFGYPTAGIEFPGMNDVMCGRGGGTNNHIGNIRFRQLVNEHKLRYLGAPKVDKPKVAMEVVQIWRKLDPPGRFLTKTDASKGDDSLWHDVGDKKAREKASQCLRERTPDVMPFVKKMQEEERKKKEEKARQKELGANGTAAVKADQTTSSASNDGSDKAPAAAAAAATTETAKKEDVKPDQAVSSSGNKMEPPPPRKKKGAREYIMDRMPTAASLSEEIFDDTATSGLSLEDYQNNVQNFLDSAPTKAAGDDYSVTDRSLLMMETMSSNSWMKSFQDIGSERSAGTMSMVEALQQKDDVSELPGFGGNNSFRVGSSFRGSSKDAATSSAHNKFNNSISMMSDMTDFSRARSTRSSKMNGSKAPSNFSMMSELTDLSEGMKDLKTS